jgi:hypothetical protein
LKNCWRRWVTAEKELDPDFLEPSINSFFVSFLLVAGEFVEKFILNIRNEKGEEYPAKTL